MQNMDKLKRLIMVLFLSLGMGGAIAGDMEDITQEELMIMMLADEELLQSYSDNYMRQSMCESINVIYKRFKLPEDAQLYKTSITHLAGGEEKIEELTFKAVSAEDAEMLSVCKAWQELKININNITDVKTSLDKGRIEEL